MTDFLDTFAELNAAFGGHDDAVTVAIDLVYEDPNQPRETFDDVELEALAASIRRRGVLQPIVLRPADPDGRYMIRFGARRYRAARLAGLVEIRAFLRGGEATDAEILIEQTLENDQRAPLTTAERARTVSRLLGMNLSQADIARELGQSKDVIAMLAAVSKMPPALQTLAKDLGVRTLYELFGAWKADKAAVETWLQGRDPRTITQTEARTLATSQRKASAPRLPAKSAAAHPEPAPRPTDAKPAWRDRTAAAAPSVDGAQVAYLLEVSAGGRLGVLDLARTPSADGEAWVLFDDTGEAASISATQLTIVRVRKAGPAASAGPNRKG